MDWQKIFTSSQVPIFLLAISYFVKRYFDLKSKKVEVNHSLFQQNKINAVSGFFANYAKVNHMWHKLSVFEVLERKISVKEIDEIIWPPINNLKNSALELKLFFKTEEHQYFQKVLDNFLHVNETLSKIYFDYDSDKTIIHRTNDFSFFLEKIKMENEKLINESSELVRKSFNN